MFLNFTKTKLTQNGLERIFTPQTTPCDIYPSFTNKDCEKVCQYDYATELCLGKMNNIMNTENVSVLEAFKITMRNLELRKIMNLEISLSRNNKNSYVPEIIQGSINIILNEDGSNVTAQMTNVRSTKFLTSCNATKAQYDALTEKGWIIRTLRITPNTEVYKRVDLTSTLWARRSQILEGWRQWHTYKKNGIPIYLEDTNIFVVLQPYDSFYQYTSPIDEGVNDIGVVKFGHSFESSDEIYADILANKLAIIREDKIAHPTAKSTDISVFTCVPVTLLNQVYTAYGNKVEPILPEACETPLKDILVAHMGEYLHISNVELSWGWETYIQEIKPQYPEINPLTKSYVDLILGERYGGVLNYNIVITSNNMDVSQDLPEPTSTNIPNQGCY